jgi:hypothetical protein
MLNYEDPDLREEPNMRGDSKLIYAGVLTSCAYSMSCVAGSTEGALESQSAAWPRANVNGSRCDSFLVLDGRRIDQGVELVNAIRAATNFKQPIHNITAEVIPCGGFLRKEPYFIRGAPSTEHHIITAVNTGGEFYFLGEILGTLNAVKFMLAGLYRYFTDGVRILYVYAAESEPSTILDVGANIGLTAAYFAAGYSKASVVGVEPGCDNYAMAALSTLQ